MAEGEWQTVSFNFADLTQPTWGDVFSMNIEESHNMSVQIIDPPLAMLGNVDIWLDDIRFLP
jgi:hypothetical protein